MSGSPSPGLHFPLRRAPERFKSSRSPLPFLAWVAAGARIEQPSVRRSVERIEQPSQGGDYLDLMRLAVRVGHGCENLHNRYMRDPQVNPIELDRQRSLYTRSKAGQGWRP